MRTLAAFLIGAAASLHALQASQAVQPAGASGTITGHVRSVGGSALPGASVEVINTRTAEKRTIAAGEEGVFRVSGLESGRYQVVVHARGYLPKPATEVELIGGARTDLDVALKRQHPDEPLRTILLF